MTAPSRPPPSEIEKRMMNSIANANSIATEHLKVQAGELLRRRSGDPNNPKRMYGPPTGHDPTERTKRRVLGSTSALA